MNKLVHGRQDPNMIGSSGPFGVIGGGGLKIAKGIYSAIKNPQKIKQIAGAFANTAKQYLKLSKGAPKANVAKKMTDHYTSHRNKLIKGGMSETEVFNRFPTRDMMTPQHLANIAKHAGRGKSTSSFKPLVTGNKVWDTKSINKAFESRFGKPQASSLEKSAQNVLRGKDSPQLNKLHQRLDAPSGYYTPDAKLMGTGIYKGKPAGWKPPTINRTKG
jgi:hypothetical protein